jgi:hypothetical protein
VDRKPRERNWGKEDCVATQARCGEVSKQKQKSAKLNKTLLLLLLLLLILA